MDKLKIISMLEEGRVKEVIEQLRGEVYKETLVKSGNKSAAKRYEAMKKFYTYIESNKKEFSKPSKVVIDRVDYYVFTNGYALAVTKEPYDSLESIGVVDFDINEFIHMGDDVENVCLVDLLNTAKAYGFKLIKSEFNAFKTSRLVSYKGNLYNLALIESAMRIIDNCSIYEVYCSGGERSPLIIRSSLGVCSIMPFILKRKNKSGLFIYNLKDYVVKESEE